MLEAAASLLAEEGFDRLTLEELAERSGVARSTIYRNWDDRSELLADAFDLLCSFAEIPDLGSMRHELEFLARELASSLQSSEWAKALPSLVGAAHHAIEIVDYAGFSNLKAQAVRAERTGINGGAGHVV